MGLKIDWDKNGVTYRIEDNEFISQLRWKKRGGVFSRDNIFNLIEKINEIDGVLKVFRKEVLKCLRGLEEEISVYEKNDKEVK